VASAEVWKYTAILAAMVTITFGLVAAIQWSSQRSYVCKLDEIATKEGVNLDKD